MPNFNTSMNRVYSILMIYVKLYNYLTGLIINIILNLLVCIKSVGILLVCLLLLLLYIVDFLPKHINGKKLIVYKITKSFSNINQWCAINIGKYHHWTDNEF